MFVEAFSGLMGGGKSFYSVVRMCEHISKGGICYSNIKLKRKPWFNESYKDHMKSFWLPEMYTDCRKELHADNTVSPVTKWKDGHPLYQYNSWGLEKCLKENYHWNYQEGQYTYLEDSQINSKLPEVLPKGTVGKPVLVLLDEALENFEANTKGNNANEEFRSFLRHIRKLGLNLIFIVQDFQSLDRKVRNLTTFVWRFRDLYNWPVPVLNRPLPMPWRDHVLAQKFHKTQFGKINAETVNKKTWIWRDPLIFGCYQSSLLHNQFIKMADDVKTDFASEGQIKQEKKKMSMLERFIVYSLIFLAFSRGGMTKETSKPEIIESNKEEVSEEENKPELIKMSVSSIGLKNITTEEVEAIRWDGIKIYLLAKDAILSGTKEEVDSLVHELKKIDRQRSYFIYKEVDLEKSKTASA